MKLSVSRNDVYSLERMKINVSIAKFRMNISIKQKKISAMYTKYHHNALIKIWPAIINPNPKACNELVTDI